MSKLEINKKKILENKYQFKTDYTGDLDEFKKNLMEKIILKEKKD